ncbi:MAG TPA: hypothetical protein VLT88_10900, partial [Desulfosarcina sp.]|nr:hypothetical protein [Desulfosarcina sp.]
MRRKAWSFSWGLTPQIFLFFVFPLTLLLIMITFGGLSVHRQAMRDLVGERDVRAVRAAAGAVSEQLNHRRIAVQTLAMSAATQNNNVPDAALDASGLESMLAQSDFLLPFFDQGLAFFSPAGELLADSGQTDFWDRLVDSPEFTSLLASADQAPVVSSSNPITGEALILVSFGAPSGPVAV